MQRLKKIVIGLFGAWSAVWGIAASAATADDWVETRSGDHLEYRSEFRLEDADWPFREFEQLSADVASTLDLKLPQQPVQWNLFHTRRSFVKHVSARVQGTDNRHALYVKGADRGRVYAYKRSDFEDDLRHETTHALLHGALPYLPLWLDEGLAEYFEVPQDKRESGNPHLKKLRLASYFAWRPDLKQLEEKDDLSEMRAEDYREAWAWVHFLLHESTASRDVLTKYLADIKEGHPPGRFSVRLFEAIPDAETRMVVHLQKWR